MQNSEMIADYLLGRARWRLDRAELDDEGRNARAALSLFDAASYIRALGDGDRLILRLHAAGRFAHGRYDPGPEGERLIRSWNYDAPDGGPHQLLVTLADSVARGLVPGQRPSR
ncbi:hypothetical protein [Actinocorallia longicatena]|uniref:hypothetical protein n=1 Tax=Actinocorallia longicatena TaxID=111803 RepID=UPI0031D34E33